MNHYDVWQPFSYFDKYDYDENNDFGEGSHHTTNLSFCCSRYFDNCLYQKNIIFSHFLGKISFGTIVMRREQFQESKSI